MPLEEHVVLSAVDPVRLFQQFATLDLLSQGRAEMVVGRGSFICQVGITDAERERLCPHHPRPHTIR